MSTPNFSTDKKIALGAVGFSFLVSLIIGLAVQNQAGIAIMRAFVCSLMFGAITYGGIYVIRQYIPEVEEAASSPEQAEQEKEEPRPHSDEDTGRLVDYLVQDENQQGYDSAADFQNDTSAAGMESAEKEEQPPSAGSSGQADQISGSAGNRPSAGEAGESSEANGSDQQKKEGQQKEGEFSEKLPSMDYLFEEELDEDVSEPQETHKEQSENSNPGAKKSYISVGDSKIPNDPQAIARAIKKVMKENE